MCMASTYVQKARLIPGIFLDHALSGILNCFFTAPGAHPDYTNSFLLVLGLQALQAHAAMPAVGIIAGDSFSDFPAYFLLTEPPPSPI